MLLLLLLLLLLIIKTESKECISIHLEFCRIRTFLIHKRGRIKGHDFTVIIWEYPRCRLGPSKISGNLKGRFCLYCFVNLVMFIFSTVNACAVRVLEIIAVSVAWEKQPTFCNATNGSTRNDVWRKRAQIPHRWLVTTLIWEVILIDWLIEASSNQKYRCLERIMSAGYIWLRHRVFETYCK